ncbi:MAG: B12-binding domain-containing radical SAM protein [Candidatus Eisenbacteria bacterium]|uniref:B12-binding domain-containing radical SAM protein n=1 Tax=Eiseniibacteriota bacterium TaxID=2212470 RepID=A0A948W775_UNCEI|nr:B12-binding domain-containing radical SAM protein [Candidatus Eisenbacteria bacterium]MBU1949539.1 B12-binding domain-containing radical SAM protein [Candidatus Eisenbacteria bacterium]MBU2691930.1 B12-binding domain-containing radical SAM protein [Candidatus Eisenbacteria bacterium]
MNVLLIYPQFPDTFWSFKYALAFVRKKSGHQPLGLITVAALLPKAWNKRLIDTNVTGLTREDLAWADLALVSAMNIQRESALSLMTRCREAGVKVVAGGPLFTAEHETFEQVDHFVLNEAELTLPPFIRDFEDGCAKEIYSTKEFADLRQSPTPLWDLVDLRHYASMSIQYSRGCPFGCEFCNVTTLFGHRPRTKSAAQVIADLQHLYDRGWRRGVFIVDDNFIGNRKQLKQELLPALISWRRGRTGMPFNTEVSINLADDEELMAMMVAAGFETVFVGIETPDDSALRECNKAQNRNRDLVESVKQIQRAGLEVQGGFIVGFDSDTPSIFQRQIDFIQRSGVVTAMVGLLQAPHGTRLYERLKKEGRLIDEMSGDNTDGSTNVIPRMTMKTLKEGYERVLSHIYAPKPYYRRIRTFLKEYNPPKFAAHLDMNDLLAVCRCAYRLGIAGKGRKQYWSLIFSTAFIRPRSLPLAIRLAIYGFHFRRICELNIR